MSTADPFQPQTQYHVTAGMPAGADMGYGPTPPDQAHEPSTSDPNQPSADALLIQQTKNEIRSLVQEITHLAQADITEDEFYQEFLTRVVQALASSGGAIWTVEGNDVRLDFQVNLPRAALQVPSDQQRHALLIRNVARSGQPTVVPPQTGSNNHAEAGNPTHHLLVVATFRQENEARGVIEIFQRPGGGPTTQRGYLRFLVQMAEVASDFLRNQRLRRLDRQQALWQRMEQFVQLVHRGLDSRATAYQIVNEGRVLIGCDRVSLTLARGQQQVATAISGLDAFDPRSEEVQRLSRLADAIARVRQPVWYTGSLENLPPEIERPLEAYVDFTHTTAVAILPLLAPASSTALSTDGAAAAAGSVAATETEAVPQRVLGTLVVEQMGDAQFPLAQRERMESVVRHSAIALANARDHEGLFLMPLWRKLGRLRWVVQARQLPRVLVISALLQLLGLALLLIPYNFELAARGKLQPAERQEIFAGIDGLIIDVPVKHQQMVEPGETLVQLKNNSLEVEIANLIGRQRATRERLLALQRAQLENRQLNTAQLNQLAGEMLELAEIETGLQRELELLREKEEQLVIRSPLRGQVVTWNVDDLLLRRPVRLGQALLSIVDPSGEWELELDMPERRMGHVTRAMTQSEQPLRVTFELASHPGRTFSGHVTEIDRVAQVQGTEGNTVLIRTTIDKAELPELRNQTAVTAKVHCGRRAIGYVIFHELLETIQSKILLWL